MKEADLKGRGIIGGPSRRGKRTMALGKVYIERLQRFRSAEHDGARHGYNVVQLRNAMSAPFAIATLRKALNGQPVSGRVYTYIVQWIDRYLPVVPAATNHELPFDHKMAAAGDRPEEE